jgi:hypothetical protein
MLIMSEIGMKTSFGIALRLTPSIEKWAFAQDLRIEATSDGKTSTALASFSRRRLPGISRPRRPAFLVVESLYDVTNSAERLNEIIQLLERKEARLVAIREGIDTSTPAGVFAATVLIAVRQFLRDSK